MDDFKQKLNLNLYYILIGVLSLVVLFVAPMFSAGGEIDLGISLPKTPIEWAIYIVIKWFVACVNILLFHCFVKQARINIKDNERYKKAMEILQRYKPKEYQPRSEREYFGQLYRRKGVSIFIASILSSVVLTNAILSFDLNAFITYSVTILMGIIFGILKMKDVENYWVGEFYDYAIEFERLKKEKE